jgi:3-hydroxyisobutyrate dehydrogenase
MAARLSESHFDLTVADAVAGRAAEFSGGVGGKAGEIGPDLAAEADMVVTMLPNSNIVGDVLFGAHGIAGRMRKGALLVEMSSGQPSVTKGFAERLAVQGCQTIDAPVSGGVSRARSGDLAIMVGGDEGVIERARPALSAIGNSIQRTGGIGTAHAMKALNNLVSTAGLLASIESLIIGKKFGLDPEVMVDILNASTGMNNSTQKKLKQFVLSRSFSSGFGLDLLVKDLTIAIDVANETSTPVPLSSLCRELTAAAAKMLGPNHDHTELAKLSELLAGQEL